MLKSSWILLLVANVLLLVRRTSLFCPVLVCAYCTCKITADIQCYRPIAEHGISRCIVYLFFFSEWYGWLIDLLIWEHCAQLINGHIAVIGLSHSYIDVGISVLVNHLTIWDAWCLFYSLGITYLAYQHITVIFPTSLCKLLFWTCWFVYPTEVKWEAGKNCPNRAIF